MRVVRLHVAGGLLLTVLLAVAALPARAAPALQLITPYPAVLVEAGRSVTFNIEVRTSDRQRVSLEVTAVPQGWNATLRGGGFVVDGVTGAPENPPQLQLEVQVPPDAAKGDYEVVLRGTAGGLSDVLPLSLEVAEAVGGAVSLTAEFPSLRGSSDTTFRFNLTLTNNTPEKTAFSLAAQGPRGWDVQARPSAEQQAATVTIEGGSSSTIQVEADPPEDVTAGSYEIRVGADGGGRSTEATLTAEVTGVTRMTLTTPNDRLNADGVAGRRSELGLVVKNEGSAPLSAVRLSASPPSGWKVTFSPPVVDIPAKQSARVTAQITPAAEAVTGDYAITLTGSGQGATDNVEIRFTVQTSRLWGLVGLLVIAGAVYVLMRVFRRFGRR